MGGCWHVDNEHKGTQGNCISKKGEEFDEGAVVPGGFL